MSKLGRPVLTRYKNDLVSRVWQRFSRKRVADKVNGRTYQMVAPITYKIKEGRR